MGRLYRTLLALNPRWVGLPLVVVGALPVLLAGMDHSYRDVRIVSANQIAAACRSVPPHGWIFRGLESSPNWWVFIAFLPLGVLFVRSMLRHTVGASPEAAPPLATLVNPEGQQHVTIRVRRALLNPWLPAAALAAVLLVAAIDARDAILPYVKDVCPREKDWTAFFLILGHGTTRHRNAWHVGVAYLVQYATAYLAFLGFGLALVHNVLYLRLIYQRRHDAAPNERIVVMIEDPECCFGQMALRPVFRLQVWYLVAGGIAVAISRYHNVATDTMNAVWKGIEEITQKEHGVGIVVGVIHLLLQTSPHDLLPDPGQWLLALGFTLVFVIVSLPSLIKFLPFFRSSTYYEGGLKDYLAEFMPPSDAGRLDHASREELHHIAGEFAANSFWPAGDSVAQRLFFFVFVVLIFILLPVPLRPLEVVIGYAFVVLSLSAGLTAAAFLFYKKALGWVDNALVTPKDA